MIVYCDESDDTGTYYSHFYGGAAVDERKIDRINASLKRAYSDASAKGDIQGEAKWTKIGARHVDGYCSLMDKFFEHVAAKEIKVRIMFMQNIYSPQDLEEYHIENQYFLLYYQFIKHAFGFQYCNPTRDADTHIVLMLDELPDNQERCRVMKDYLAGLSNYPVFSANRIVVPRSEIAEVRSRDHIISQCLDVVLGSMQFRLNDKHLEKPKGSNRRGKRTIAKDKVYRHVNRKVREIYPNFNIGTNTGRPEAQDLWRHPYRHWNFRPALAKVDNSRAKPRNRK